MARLDGDVKDMKHMKYILMFMACLAMVGCDEGPSTDKLVVTPKVAPTTNQVETVERFVVHSQGTFKAGYDNAVREVFIIKDTHTGVEYLGITDCTLIKIKQKEQAIQDAADSAADIALDIATSIATDDATSIATDD
jgi:hypothetical protein